MQGADKWYDLIDKADRYKLGNIIRTGHNGYGYTFQYENVVFILSEHARGKTFNIWIYKTKDIKDTDEHLEVYGMTGGQPGWTETYGWLCYGTWKDFIEEYMRNIESQVYYYEHKIEIEQAKEKKRLADLKENKIIEFNNYFSEHKPIMIEHVNCEV